MKKNNPNQNEAPKARKDTEFAGSLTPDMDVSESSAKHASRNAAHQLKSNANEKPGSQR